MVHEHVSAHGRREAQDDIGGGFARFDGRLLVLVEAALGHHPRLGPGPVGRAGVRPRWGGHEREDRIAPGNVDFAPARLARMCSRYQSLADRVAWLSCDSGDGPLPAWSACQAVGASPLLTMRAQRVWCHSLASRSGSVVRTGFGPVSMRCSRVQATP